MLEYDLLNIDELQQTLLELYEDKQYLEILIKEIEDKINERIGENE